MKLDINSKMEDREEYESQRLAREIRSFGLNPVKVTADENGIASMSEDELLNSKGWTTITLPDGNTYTYNKTFWDKLLFGTLEDLEGTVGDNNLNNK